MHGVTKHNSGTRALRKIQQSSSASWWQAPLAAELSRFSSSENGLSQKAAAARLRRDGPNIFSDEPRHSLISQFAKRFKNPLVLILLVASTISGVTGEVASFVIIIVMILMSVMLDFFQEYRANLAAEKLRQSVLVRANVLRDGVIHKLAVAKLVQGDVVLLAAGDLVPADGRLIEASNLYVNQSMLTGESYPVEKNVGEPPDAGTEIDSATNALFMATTIISGTAKMLVCHIGANTSIGKVAHSIADTPLPTSFEQGTRRFGILIVRLTIFMVLFVLFANAITHKPWLDSFLFALALAVGLTPELLPMVVSVTLARGATRMAERNVIVKRLSAIEDLGAMDVLCTDKTGTLTEAKIQLQQHVDLDGNQSERAIFLSYLNSYFETGIKTPMDEAILAHTHFDIADWQKIDEVPFDFERRRVSVLVKNSDQHMLVVKGAPEAILRQCTQHETADADQLKPIDATTLAAATARCDLLARQGFRVLAVAWKAVSEDHVHAGIADEAELILVGFTAFLDPPKASAKLAMQGLADAGVTVKIVTGDNEAVTRHVCEALDIAVHGVLTGTDMNLLDDEALAVRVDSVNLFCRVNPTQKNRVVDALKRRGHVVGFIGDGINDAPALHAADVGLSVDSAVDVAKEAADMILLKQDLGVLHDGVMEGRRTFANIRKYIMMGTSSNFGNMFSMAGASLFLPFLAMMPTQILLNNILYDVSETAIPLDRVDDIEIQLPQCWDMAFIRNFMLVIGPVSSLFDFLTFYILLKVLNANEALFQTGWFVESLATQVLVIFVIRTRYVPFGRMASRPGGVLIGFAVLIIALAITLTFTPLGAYFGFVPLPGMFFAVLAAMVVAYLLLAQLTKYLFYRFGVASSESLNRV